MNFIIDPGENSKFTDVKTNFTVSADTYEQAAQKAARKLFGNKRGLEAIRTTGDTGMNGEGGDPFALASGETWEIVDDTPTVEYDPQDHDTWWSAQAKIVKAAKRLGIEVPDYAEAE